MAKYSGTRRSITPSTTNDNWTLDGGAGKIARVLDFNFGGEVTTSTAMQTRVARASAQAGAGTAGNVAKFNPNDAANAYNYYTTYATTQPTLDAGDLFTTSWNAHGGNVRWLAAPGEEILLVGAASPASATTLSCRNSVGTATSSYGVIWEE